MNRQAKCYWKTTRSMLGNSMQGLVFLYFVLALFHGSISVLICLTFCNIIKQQCHGWFHDPGYTPAYMPLNLNLKLKAGVICESTTALNVDQRNIECSGPCFRPHLHPSKHSAVGTTVQYQKESMEHHPCRTCHRSLCDS